MDKLNNLLSWAEYNNFYISKKIDFIIRENEGSTVIALDDISPNEKLIECPIEFIIGLGLAKDIFSKIQFSNEDEQIYIKFAFLYHVLLGSKSKWNPYISILPNEEEIISPFYFNNEDLQWLQGTNIAQELDAKKDVWKSQFDKAIKEITPAYPDLSFTFSQYIWANLIFLSRSFPGHMFDSSINKSISVLVPIIDSLNHQPLTPIHWDCSTGKGFNLLSGNSLTKGDEIFNNYGAKGNEELLIGYGFTIKDNIFDIVSLRLPLRIVQMINDTPDAPSDLPQDGVFHLTKDTIPTTLKTAFQIITSTQRDLDPHSILCKLISLEDLSKALHQKLSKINSITKKPTNIRQQFSQFYRDGQISIYNSSILQCQEEVKTILSTIPSTTTIIDIETISSTDESFLPTMFSAFDITTHDGMFQQGLEDQILMTYIAKLLITNKLPSPPLQSEQEPTQDLSFYEELSTSLPPLLRKVDPQTYNSNKWNDPQTFLSAGIYLQNYGYSFFDNQGIDRYRCIIE